MVALIADVIEMSPWAPTRRRHTRIHITRIRTFVSIPECTTHIHTYIYAKEFTIVATVSAVQKRVRACARVLSARGNLLLFIYFTIILFAHDHRRCRRRRYIPKLSKHENRERTRPRRRIYFK